MKLFTSGIGNDFSDVQRGAGNLAFADRAKVRALKFSSKLCGDILRPAESAIAIALSIFKVNIVGYKGFAKAFVAFCFIAAIQCNAEPLSPKTSNPQNETVAKSVTVIGRKNIEPTKEAHMPYPYFSGFSRGLAIGIFSVWIISLIITRKTKNTKGNK